MMSFLDGSVRLEKSGGIVCDRSSMHMIPGKPSVANAGWIWPDHPQSLLHSTLHAT